MKMQEKIQKKSHLINTTLILFSAFLLFSLFTVHSIAGEVVQVEVAIFTKIHYVRFERDLYWPQSKFISSKYESLDRWKAKWLRKYWNLNIEQIVESRLQLPIHNLLHFFNCSHFKNCIYIQLFYISTLGWLNFYSANIFCLQILKRSFKKLFPHV